MKKAHDDWQETVAETQTAKKNQFELQNNSEIKPSDEEPNRRQRKKTLSDVGSRWVAPILLLITVILSLLLQLFKK